MGYIRLITLTIAAAIAVPSLAIRSAAAEDAEARAQRELPAAIRALYGVGLSIKKDGDSISVDWGTLDAATWQRYATDYYLPALKTWSSVLMHEWDIVFGESRAWTKKLSAHVLVEPVEKHGLCRGLVRWIEDRDKKDELKDFCTEQQLRHVGSPVVAFRGTAVSYEAPTGYVGVALGDPLFAGTAGRRDVLITVPGPGIHDSYRAYVATPWIANNIPHQSSQRVKDLAAELLVSARRGLASAKKRMARRDKPFAKSRGNVVFTDEMVEGWDPIHPIKRSATPRCRDSYAQIYGPRRRGSYDLTVRANGVLCSNDIESGGVFIKRWSMYGQCRDHLEPGKNEITVVISKNVNRVAGRRLSKNKLRKVKYHSNRVGRALVRAKLTCTK
jgi:hypothetical protein